MANDPYSPALLKEPKMLAVNPDADSPQADVCGFAVRDVTLQAGGEANAFTRVHPSGPLGGIYAFSHIGYERR